MPEQYPAKNPEEADEDKPKWTDKTVAAFTLLLFLAAVIQGIIFYKQWQEMHSGGSDTHELAVAAKAQAEESKIQVEKMTASLSKTDQLIVIASTQVQAALNQVHETNALAVQAQRSADYARDAVKASVELNRPWIIPDSPPHDQHTIREATLHWHNRGNVPAVAVFSAVEYFVSAFPPQLRTCMEMQLELKKQPMDKWQYESFVAKDQSYATGLANPPPWSGSAPIQIHGCVWYTDILSNTERVTEFFYTAFQMKFGFPVRGDGIDLFYPAERPAVYK